MSSGKGCVIPEICSIFQPWQVQPEEQRSSLPRCSRRTSHWHCRRRPRRRPCEPCTCCSGRRDERLRPLTGRRRRARIGRSWTVQCTISNGYRWLFKYLAYVQGSVKVFIRLQQVFNVLGWVNANFGNNFSRIVTAKYPIAAMNG